MNDEQNLTELLLKFDDNGIGEEIRTAIKINYELIKPIFENIQNKVNLETQNKSDFFKKMVLNFVFLQIGSNLLVNCEFKEDFMKKHVDLIFENYKRIIEKKIKDGKLE